MVGIVAKVARGRELVGVGNVAAVIEQPVVGGAALAVVEAGLRTELLADVVEDAVVVSAERHSVGLIERVEGGGHWGPNAVEVDVVGVRFVAPRCGVFVGVGNVAAIVVRAVVGGAALAVVEAGLCADFFGDVFNDAVVVSTEGHSVGLFE